MAHSIDDLRILFGLPSRQAVSKLVKALDLVPAEREKFSQEQMTLMYELHTYLASGKNLADFPKTLAMREPGVMPPPPSIEAEVVPLPREPEVLRSHIVPTNNPINNSTNNSPGNDNPLGELIRAITQATTPKPDLLHNYHALEDAVKHQWIISSSNVKELTGSHPHGDRFIWANFEFLKAGKVGRESGWRVRNLPN